MSKPVPRIGKITTLVLPDKAVEFCILIGGKINRCTIDYGNGKSEATTLPDNASINPIIYAEHLYKVGYYTVQVKIFDEKNKVLDQKTVSWSQN